MAEEFVRKLLRCQGCGKKLEPEEVHFVELPAFSCAVYREAPLGLRKVMLCEECVKRRPKQIYMGHIEFENDMEAEGQDN